VDTQQVKELIVRELPKIVKQDMEVQQLILRLSRDRFADKAVTESRFDRVLEELRRDREEQRLKWDEQKREEKEKWEEQNRKWDEQRREEKEKWEEQNRKWEEQKREEKEKWEEQNRKWDENQAEIRELFKSLRRLDSTVGALGARWGLHSEESFRNALRGILEESFDVEVLNVTEYDDEGDVFGRPDQVELDLIIKDGLLIICEIKSSMSRGDMYIFERKVRFYEKRHERQASRALVISPMVDEAARTVANRLGIEVYSHAEDVDSGAQ